MDQHKNLDYWKKRKIEAEKSVKMLLQKREETLYLYEVEKQSKRKTRESQLKALLDLETKELQQAKIYLQNLDEHIKKSEREQQKNSNIKVFGLISIFIVLSAIFGLLLQDGNNGAQELEEDSIKWLKEDSGWWTDNLGRFFRYLKKFSFGSNSLTGAVIGLPEENCREEKFCANETITTCINETVLRCSSGCVNETKEVCSEQCAPTCSVEKVNGIEREVCVQSCSNVCVDEIVETCSQLLDCEEVVEEKCSSKVAESCVVEEVCEVEAEESSSGGLSIGIPEEIVDGTIEEIKEGITEDITEDITEEIADGVTGAVTREADTGPGAAQAATETYEGKKMPAEEVPKESATMINFPKIDSSKINSSEANVSEPESNYMSNYMDNYVEEETATSLFPQEISTAATTCDEYIELCKGSSEWVGGTTYCLLSDITGQTATCMDGLNSNITLDCLGHTIDGDDTAAYGINADSAASPFTNITIKNCVISDFSRGMRLENINNSWFENNTLFSNSVYGIEGITTKNITVISSNFSNQNGASDTGIYINSNNLGWNISSNNFTGNYYGIQIGATSNLGVIIENNRIESGATGGYGIYFLGDYVTARDNIFRSNPIAMYFSSGANDNNLTNNQMNGSTSYAVGFTSTSELAQRFDSNTIDGDNFVHCANNNSFTSNHEFVNQNRVSNLGSAIIYRCGNAILNNLSVWGSQAYTYGLRIVESDNVTVNESSFFNNTHGMYLDNAGTGVRNLTVKNSNFSTQVSIGLYAISAAKNVTIFNNIFEKQSGSGDRGILFGSSNRDWNISSNNFTSNYYGIEIGATSNLGLIIENNRFESGATGGYGIYFQGDYVTARDNVFLSNPVAMYFYSGANDNNLTNNQMDGSTSYAVGFTSTAELAQRFEDNTINGDPLVHCANNNSFTSNHEFVNQNLVTNQGSAIIYRCGNAILNNLSVWGSQAYTYGLRIVESDNVTVNESSFFNNTYGMYLDNSGTGVRNLTVKNSNFSAQTSIGLYAISAAKNVTIFNNIFEKQSGGSDRGILFGNSNRDWNISSNNFTSNYYGIEIGATSNLGLIIENNRFESGAAGGYGIYFQGDYVTARDNVFLSNPVAMYFYSGANDNNLTSNQMDGSTSYAVGFYTVTELAQRFENNTINGDNLVHCYNNHTFTSNHERANVDKITNQGSAIIYRCNNAVLNNLTIGAERYIGYGLRLIESNNSLIDNSTFYNNTRGIYLDNTGTRVNNLTIRNSNFSANTVNGIYALNAGNITIFNSIFELHNGGGDEGLLISSNNVDWNISSNNFTSNYQGVEVGSTNNIRLSFHRNIFFLNTLEGISLSGDDNTFWENTFENNTEALDVEVAATGNLFYRNNFINSSTRLIEGGTSNQFNLSSAAGEGGNYWDDFDTAGEGCSDANGDGYCDAPRNSTIHASFTGQDNHPYKAEISFVVAANTPPTQETPVLNTTNLALNDTTVNLTAYNISTADIDADSVKSIFNWRRNNTPIALLNMPFEGINDTTSSNAWDYSGLGNSGNDAGGIIWNASGGYDGRGAYEFDAVDDHIATADVNSLDTGDEVSFEFRIKPRVIGGALYNRGSQSTTVGYHWITIDADSINYEYPNGASIIAVASDALSWTTDQWYHVAITHNNATKTIKFYRDGTNVGTTTYSDNALHVGSAAGAAYIGTYQGLGTATYAFNGTMDEVRIYNRTLSSEQIWNLYANRTNEIVRNETLRGENWSVEVTPNDGSSDGAMAVSNNVTILNALPTQGTPILNTTNLALNDTTVNLTAYNISTADADGDRVKNIFNWKVNNTPIAVLNMPFEGVNDTASNNALDYSGYGNDGTENNAAWNSTGGFDGKGAYEFRGIDNVDLQYVEIADDNSLDFNSTSEHFTVAAWLKHRCPTCQTYDGAISKGVSGNCLENYAIIMNSNSGKPRFSLSNTTGCSATKIVTATTVFTADRWYHVAGTYDGTNIAIYVNGVLETSAAANIIPSSNTGTLRIGWGHNTQMWNGSIDEVMIFNRSLSAEQIWNLYANKTDEIASGELAVGNNWSVEVTPNDGFEDGQVQESNGVLVLPTNNIPTQGTPILNTTNLALNDTTVNLTAYNVSTADVDGDRVKSIFNWKMNNTPIAVLNMPFEGVNDTATNNAWDYSGYGNNGSDQGNAFWNSTGGFDGKGAYQFDADGDYINVGDKDSLDFGNGSFTISFWAQKNLVPTNGYMVSKGCPSCGSQTGYSIELNSNAETGAHNIVVRLDDDPDGGTTIFVNTGVNSGTGWHHYAAVFDRDGENDVLYVYNDGALISSPSINAANGSVSNAFPFYIGTLTSTAGEFNGTIDEVMVFNRSLSAEQVWNLFANRTYEIVRNETLRGENWSVEVTPNDGYEDGAMAVSNDVTILNALPTQGTPILNTTNITTNTTNTNLTAYNISTADVDGDRVKSIYNWKMNNTPIAVLNMPFEGVNDTASNNALDYSGYDNDGIETLSPIWNATGGFDGKGAYRFGPGIGCLSVTDNNNLEGMTSISFSVWVRPENIGTAYGRIIDKAFNGVYSLYYRHSGEFGFALVTDSGSVNDAACGTLTNEAWNHVAATWSNTTGKYECYINGEASGQGGSLSGSKVANNAQGLGIGCITGGSTIFNGTIDEVMIFNRSLSAEQIWNLYANRTYEIVRNETLRGENWSVEVTPNDGYEDGAMLVSNNVTIRNSKPTHSTPILNTTNLALNDTTVNLTAYNISTADTVDGDSVKSIFNWKVNNTPIALLNMPFEGVNDTTSSNAWDYSGLGNSGNDAGGIIWNASGGYDGRGAYEFDAVDDHIATADTNSLNTGDEVSFEFRIKPRVIGGALYNRGAQSTTVGYHWITIDADSINYEYPNGASVVAVASDALTWTANQWYHVAITHNNATKTIKFYRDGANVGTTTYSDNALHVGSAAGAAYLGTYQGQGTATYAFNGTMDEVRIYNRTLSAEQVWNLYVNKTDEIASGELVAGNNWSVEVTPNDGYDDGQTLESNGVLILPAAAANTPPTQGTPILNTTNLALNDTTVNLTAYNISTADVDGDRVKSIFNWKVNNTPIAVLNMPFEGINDTTSSNAWDYSGYANNGSDQGGVWNATGGYDGKGAYQFDGLNNNQITITNPGYNLDKITISAWVYPTSNSGNRAVFETSTTLFQVNGAQVQWWPDTGLANTFVAASLLDKWSHVAVTHDYTTNHSIIYINGANVKDITVASKKQAWTRATIGDYSSSRKFNGTIDELIIFNRTLSAEQVWNLFANRTNEISRDETIVGENWSVEVTPNDGYDDGAMLVSNNVTILNFAPPAPILVSPANESTTTSRTPTFIWNNSVDSDSDPNISYRLEIDDNILFNNPEVNVTGILNTTNDNTTYSISTELAVDTTYFWRVFAYDQIEYSATAMTGNFTVQSYLAINITDSSVNFGSLSNGANASTPTDAAPFRAENIGNIIANITVTATGLFNMVPMPSTFYQFKIRANESGAFNVSASSTSWTPLNNTNSPFHVIDLDWRSISNDFITDLNISVPLNESAGVKSSTVTFTITG